MTAYRLLRFGDPEASSDTVLSLDLDNLLASRLLIQANSGGGKSRAIRYLLETTNGKVQHIVIDREGEFATLREKYPYLLAGAGGDVAADLRSAKLLARKVMELGLSVIVDLSDMSLPMQKDYVRSFVEAINHLPRTLWQDCLIIIDEAHIFAPESGKGKSAATEAISLLLSTGRKRGYCAVLATQRLAKLNKDVASECLNKLIGRTSNDDLKRAGEELGLAPSVARQLLAFEPGTFWVYGPAVESVGPVLVRTGKVQTSPPPRGAARSLVPAAPEAIRKVLAELADLPKQADEEASTVEALQRKNAELRRELAVAIGGQSVREVEVRVPDPDAIKAAVLKERESWDHHRRKAAELIGKAVEWVTVPPESAVAYFVEHTGAPASAVRRALAKIESVAGVDKAPEVRVNLLTVDPRPNGDLPRGARRMLEVLAKRYPDKPTRSQLGKLAGFTPSGGTFGNYLRELKARDYVIEEGSGQLAITDRGFGYSGVPKMALIKTPAAMYEMWAAVLNAGERKMLDVVRKVHPDPITREDLGAMSGFTVGGGTFGNYYRTLKRNGLVAEQGDHVVLGAELVGA